MQRFNMKSALRQHLVSTSAFFALFTHDKVDPLLWVSLFGFAIASQTPG
jgi:hypothetical protein